MRLVRLVRLVVRPADVRPANMRYGVKQSHSDQPKNENCTAGEGYENQQNENNEE